MIVKNVEEHGCPMNTDSCSGQHCSDPNNCFCDYHCSWTKCRLFEKPENCLGSLDYGWKWNPEEMLWTAVNIGIQNWYMYDGMPNINFLKIIRPKQ